MSFLNIKRAFIGKPLKSAEAGEQKLNIFKALAILSSDALSSVAYGTEQILLVLMTVGVASFWYSIPISFGVLFLLAALILSYRQVIFSYPKGGGAYMVAKENLGTNYGLIAGSSLLIDYILTVAVSVSAGTDALTSAFPGLHNFSVPISVLMVLIITVLNLRGVTESASALAYPVYLFVIGLFVLIGVGVFKIFAGSIPHTSQTHIGMHVGGIGLFLLLKAFSSGCSALTGVEAISNAIPNFKTPADKNAAKTLTLMGSLLGMLFIGIAFITYWYGVAPNDHETVISQVAEQTFGRNYVYYFIQGTTALILILAANTGFNAFPLLAYNFAKDRFMPNMFTIRGDRLGYSNGIIVLSVMSILVIVLFHGKTENLIPLYAVGVFLPFTLAQVGMMMKWIRQKPTGWVTKFSINTVGALITFTVLMIFFVTKFDQVWYSLIFLPLVVFICKKINEHYQNLAEQLRIDINAPHFEVPGNVIVVPVANITQSVERSIAYAKSLSQNVIAVYVGFDNEALKRMEGNWEKWNTGVRLVALHSYYRSVSVPLMKFIDTVNHRAQENDNMVTVLIPEFVPKKAWQRLLHNQSGFFLRTLLISKKNVVVSTMPYHLKK